MTAEKSGCTLNLESQEFSVNRLFTTSTRSTTDRLTSLSSWYECASEVVQA